MIRRRQKAKVKNPTAGTGPAIIPIGSYPIAISYQTTVREGNKFPVFLAYLYLGSCHFTNRPHACQQKFSAAPAFCPAPVAAQGQGPSGRPNAPGSGLDVV